MRALTAITAILAALVIALPAAAQDPVPTQPCAPVEGVTVVGNDGETTSVTPTAMVGFGWDISEQPDYNHDAAVRLEFMLDVSGDDKFIDAKKGTINLALDWDDDVSDFDFFGYDANGSKLGEGVNNTVLQGASEAMSFTLNHCARFSVDVLNYSGLPTAQITLTQAVSAKR